MPSGIFGSIHSIDMLRMGDSDLNMIQRCCYNLKDVLKQMMLRHEAIFRQQVYDLHRLYNMQQKLMNDLAFENSCGWSKDQYAASISSQKDTDIASRFCSSAIIDPLRPFYASSSAFVAACCSLCEQKRNARYNDPGHLTFDLQLHSGIYTSDAGSQSASNCIEMKDCVVNNLKITIFAENEECRKGGTGRIMFCKDINLELPADKLTLEDAEGSSSVDESQANAARIEPRSLLHSVSELPYLRAPNSEGQDPLAFDFGHNARPVSRSTMNQSCGSSKALSIDLNIPQIGESPSMCSDPLIFSSTTASSSCGINGPTESVTDQSTRLPLNAWIPGRDVHAEVFGSTTVLLPPQLYSSCNQNDMEMKHTRSSFLPINDSSRLKNIHANLMSGSLVFGRERMEMEMANGGQCKNSFVETSVVTSNFLHKEGGETSTQSVAEKHYKEDPVSSTGNEDFSQVDNHPGVFCIPYGTSDSNSVEDKSGAEQVIEMDKRDISSEEHPTSLEEFQVVQAELSVDKCSIEKLEVLENQACECLQEKSSQSSKDCFHVEEVQQQQEAVLVDIIIQNAAEALISISQEKPAGTSEIEYNCLPSSETAKDESGYLSDSYVSLVLQLPEINTEDCSSLAKPVGKETTIGNNTSRLKLRRRLMDFQRDVLPGLVRLSRHEICEDTHMMGELIRCTEANVGGRRGKWFMPTRSRRSRHH